MSESSDKQTATKPPPLPNPTGTNAASGYNPYYAQQYGYNPMNPYYQYNWNQYYGGYYANAQQPAATQPNAPSTGTHSQSQSQAAPPSGYYTQNTAPVRFTWNHNPSNPPPPPPKSLINPNKPTSCDPPPSSTNPRQVEWKNKQMVSSSSSSSRCPASASSIPSSSSRMTSNMNSNGSADPKSRPKTPPELEKYIERAFRRFKQLPAPSQTKLNRDKLEKQLQGKIKTAKSHGTLFTVDWNNEPFPPLLRHLISLSGESASPRKRKADSEWDDRSPHRKVARSSMSQREVLHTESFVESPIPSSFVSPPHSKQQRAPKSPSRSVKSTESNSDMSCSESSSPVPKHVQIGPHPSSNQRHPVKFRMASNNEASARKQFLNPFTGASNSSSSHSHSHSHSQSNSSRGSDSEDEFSWNQQSERKVKKKRKKKGKKRKKNGFSWDTGFEGMEVEQEGDIKEMDRILERRRRFESKGGHHQKGNGNHHRSFVTKKGAQKKKKSHSVEVMGRTSQQIMDWHEHRVVGTSTKVEKEYFRLTQIANPAEVRTLETLKKAFKLLMVRWRTKSRKDYLYVGGQFKSLRQDLRVQHIRSTFTVKVYEENARICLEVGDLSEFNQCQGQLKELYRENELFGKSYIEFLCYRLLYEAVTKNWYGVQEVIRTEKRWCREKEVRQTLLIVRAIERTDYHTFFKLYAQCWRHGKCILDQIIYKIRYLSLCRISISYCPSLYPVAKLTATIGFNEESECIEYLRNTGCVLRQNGQQLMLDCKASRGKVKEFTPKSKDDELGVTHGSVYHSKNQDRQSTITHFLRK